MLPAQHSHFIGPATAPTPHTCDHCRRLVIDPLKTARLSENTSNGLLQHLITFPIRFGEASQKPMSRCPTLWLHVLEKSRSVADDWRLCLILAGEDTLEGFDRARFLWLPDNELPPNVTFHGYQNKSTDMRNSFDWNSDCWSPEQGSVLKQSLEAGQHSSSLWMDVVVEKDSAASVFLSTRHSVRDPSSSRSFSLARTWLQKCSTCHDCVDPRTGALWPRRLLYLDSARHIVRLEELCDRTTFGSYCALSYCWGGEQDFKTTTSNVQSYQESIPVAKLPQTIQDAIRVTQEMGFARLWVDSLCIVQDDPLDMAHELARMVDIYAGAALTIAAANAVTCHVGFLRPSQRENDCWSQRFSLPFRHANGQLENIILRPVAYNVEETCPLHHRAWTFQECVVSSRLLIYGATQLVWCCSAGMMSESSGNTMSSDWLLRDVGWARQIVRLKTRSTPYPAESVEPPLKAWSRLVELYTTRQLTNLSDTLPAFSAIAQKFGQAYCRDNAEFEGSRNYLAGLWRDDLPLTLLWQNVSQGTRRNTIPQPLPTWSWLSSPDCRIQWDILTAVDYVQTVDVVDVSVELSSPQTPYGSVSSGRIILKGRIKHIIAKTPRDSTTIEGYPLIGDSLDLRYNFDDHREKHPSFHGYSGWLLEVGRKKEISQETDLKFTVAGLILEECKGAGCMTRDIIHLNAHQDLAQFRRVGVFRLMSLKSEHVQAPTHETNLQARELCSFMDSWIERSLIIV